MTLGWVMNYKEQLEIFHSSCRLYPQGKKKAEDMKNMSRELDPNRKQNYAYLCENVQYVEGMMDELCRRCGTNSRVLVWLLFVCGKTQKDVADRSHISRRQLQYSVDHWMRILLEKKEYTPQYQDLRTAFRSSCRTYLQEVNSLSEIRKNADDDPSAKQLSRYVQEDIQYTETVFHRIETEYGEKECHLIWLVYVKGLTQEKVAESFHMTRRQLQYSIDQCLRNVLKCG